MSECTHCNGTGKCQDDFHSGTLSGNENGPSLSDNFFGHCPSCGDGNTEYRPDCPHCDGKGDPDKWCK